MFTGGDATDEEPSLKRQSYPFPWFKKGNYFLGKHIFLAL